MHLIILPFPGINIHTPSHPPWTNLNVFRSEDVFDSGELEKLYNYHSLDYGCHVCLDYGCHVCPAPPKLSHSTYGEYLTIFANYAPTPNQAYVTSSNFDNKLLQKEEENKFKQN